MLQFFSSVDDTTMSFTVAKMVANCLAYMNSCVNPVLYAFLSDNFRKAFFRLVACCRAGRHGGVDGFNALRKMEMEQTNVGGGGGGGPPRRVSPPQAAAAGASRGLRVDDDGEIEPTAALTQQTHL